MSTAEILKEVDVLVCGGGVSGCAAAVAAARADASVLLVERNGFLGGIASTSMISNIYNHYVAKDGRIVMRGIGTELADRLVKRNAGTPHWKFPDGRLVHDPEQLKLVFNEMMEEAGVEVLLNSLAVEPVAEDGAIRGVHVDTAMGRRMIRAGVVIDTTGECDLAWAAKAPVRQAAGLATLTFKMGNVDMERLYLHFKAHPETFPAGIDAMKDFHEFEDVWLNRGVLYFPHSGGEDWDLFQNAIARGEFQKEKGNIFGMDSACIIGMKGHNTAVINSQFWRIVSIDPEIVAPAEMEAHEACFYVADFMIANIPGFENAYIAQISDEIAIRVSRGIIGEETFDKDEKTVRGRIESDDAVANGTDIEYRILRDVAADPRYVKSAQQQEGNIRTDDVIACRPAQKNFKLTGEFVSNYTVDIPFGVMLPLGVENLLVASGKSVSCVPQTMLRYQSAGMALGQAAGAAGALAARKGIAVRKLDIRELQKELLRQDVYLGDGERLMELGLAGEEDQGAQETQNSRKAQGVGGSRNEG
jgi:hypothetical protein